jgi:amino acid transporter
LVTCLFGIAFISVGNMAGNSINFAIRVMQAAGYPNPSNGTVRGIAIAVATFACFIHAFSRRGGIWLNNLLAIVKLAMMALIIIAAIVVGAGGFPNTKNVIADNTETSKSFANASTEANGYAHAFLAIIFTFSGFEQPNYVLGEISRPRRNFPISMGAGVSLVVSLYLAVNICYVSAVPHAELLQQNSNTKIQMVVVPKNDQINYNVAQRFFELTFSQINTGDNTGYRIFNAFLAISSFGNIVVMTYTAARVKQEIAKEGILPWAKFFAQNTDMSVGRLLKWFQRKGWFGSLLRLRWFSPEEHSEKTPVGALVLHFLSCLVLIFATYGMDAGDAYNLLTSLSAYVINAFFGTLLGLGILILRTRGPPPTMPPDDVSAQDPASSPPTWRQLVGKRFSPALSIFAATVYTLGNLYPVITTWIPPSGEYKKLVKATLAWYIVPTVSWCIIAAGAIWFLGFVAAARSVDKKHHRVFVVEKKPEFEPADSSSKPGGLVLVHETVYLSWVGRETLKSRRPTTFEDDGAPGMGQVQGQVSPYTGTDFDGYFNNFGNQTGRQGTGDGYR